ncbi:MAG: 50S ribosomal protein L9 [Deltaproteobacteria bacterium]|nr:50S ribosomal protein L9 [Deltaproteobacteria bacterium]
MNVILLSDVEAVGKVGDMVRVADGYARNFLIPKKLAVKATERSVKQLAHQKRTAEARRKRLTDAAESLKRKIETLEITIQARVGEENKLFGSVTVRDIHAALAAQDVDVDRRRIVLADPIKSAGTFDVPVKLGYDVTATARVRVESDAPEAAPAPVTIETPEPAADEAETETETPAEE